MKIGHSLVNIILCGLNKDSFSLVTYSQLVGVCSYMFLSGHLWLHLLGQYHPHHNHHHDQFHVSMFRDVLVEQVKMGLGGMTGNTGSTGG